jgi:hypothetical protein
LALVAAPLALLLLLQRPTRFEAMLGLLLLGLTAWSMTGATDGFSKFEASWVCLLSGGVAIALGIRGRDLGGRLIAVGLIAVGTAAVAGVLLIALTSFSWGELFWHASRRFSMIGRITLSMLTRTLAESQRGPEILQAMELKLDQTVLLVTRMLPALILLQSMMALGFAWTLYRRIVRHPEGEPLPRLREFRFSDHLIWGVVFALVALVVPGTQAMHTLGANFATFFGGLYVVRGLGIVAAMAAAAGVGGPFVAILATVVLVLLSPWILFGPLALGVMDTWVDWRKIAAKAKP